MSTENRFKFRKVDVIGAVSAEDDIAFLKECFIDTGDYSVLSDCTDSRRIIVGRTGSGKTALLWRLSESEEHVIIINPENLALAYITNSTILKFLTQIGVRLDIFFKLLWRHVFTVEILKTHFKIQNESDKQSFILKISSLFKDKKHTKAIEYLQKWGKSFWEETEYRIKEVTTTLENNIKSELKASTPLLAFNVGEIDKLTEEQKHEIIQRAQYVVNQVQIRELTEIINLLDDVLGDSQKRYFLLIDRLDENWVDDGLRFRMIRGLIETVKDFSKVRSAKVIVALRLDLLHKVFRLTRDAGYQEEKYESLFLRLSWTKADLIKILDKRIDFLIKQRYTSQPVTHKDIFPKTIKSQSSIDFILERTFKRPRDIIVFFNYMIQEAIDSVVINSEMIHRAEAQYSRARLKSLADEWFGEYPNLLQFAGAFLQCKKKNCNLSEIDMKQYEEFCLDFSIRKIDRQDFLSIMARQVAEGTITIEDFIKSLFSVFYLVGLVGLKLESYEAFAWSSNGVRTISTSEITMDCKVSIHPTFYRVLGISDK
jgi:hypothetical protein